jgi:hypothetical protein
MSSHLVQAIVAFPAMVLLSALTFVGAYHVMRVGYGVPRTARFLRGFGLRGVLSFVCTLGLVGLLKFTASLGDVPAEEWDDR